MSVHPQDKRAAVGESSGKIRVYDLRNGKPIRTVAELPYQVEKIVYSNDGGRLAALSWDGSIRIWEIWNRNGRTLYL